MEASIFDVSKFILVASRKAGDLITNLKLQKLAYYAEAWYCAIYDKELTGEDFEAWVHGPVCPKLYNRYKRWGFESIPFKGAKPKLSKRVDGHLKEVLDAYSRFSAWDLERMTHQETPWINARKGLAPTESGNTVISVKDMRKFYGKQAG